MLMDEATCGPADLEGKVDAVEAALVAVVRFRCCVFPGVIAEDESGINAGVVAEASQSRGLFVLRVLNQLIDDEGGNVER